MPIYSVDPKGGVGGRGSGPPSVLVWLRSGSTATPGGSTAGGLLKRLASAAAVPLRLAVVPLGGGSTAAVPLELPLGSSSGLSWAVALAVVPLAGAWR